MNVMAAFKGYGVGVGIGVETEKPTSKKPL